MDVRRQARVARRRRLQPTDVRGRGVNARGASGGGALAARVPRAGLHRRHDGFGPASHRFTAQNDDMPTHAPSRQYMASCRDTHWLAPMRRKACRLGRICALKRTHPTPSRCFTSGCCSVIRPQRACLAASATINCARRPCTCSIAGPCSQCSPFSSPLDGVRPRPGLAYGVETSLAACAPANRRNHGTSARAAATQPRACRVVAQQPNTATQPPQPQRQSRPDPRTHTRRAAHGMPAPASGQRRPPTFDL